jgi:hypothetical protein
MVSNVSTADGLGFEEVNQATDTDLVSGANIYGTTGSFVNARITTANIATGTFTSLNDTNGALKSNILGSATSLTYGGYVQAGSILTTTGSIGFIKFGVPFTSATSYYVTATPCGSSAGTFWAGYTSGLKHASGVNFVGAANLRYDFVAVGI